MALIGATLQQRIKILEEIKETTDNKLEENKAIMKQWISTQSHLPHNYDERILASFIRGCKHDLEISKKKITNYFTYRTLMPELFSQRDPTDLEIQEIRKCFLAFPLPKLTPSGCRVTIHVLTPECGKIDVRSVCKYLLMLGDVRLIEEGPISGDIFIFDARNVRASVVAKMFNPVIKKTIMCTQNALPQRLKQVHILNGPAFLDTGINFIKMFVKQKIRERFHIHRNVSTLYKYVPQEILPSDYYAGNEHTIAGLQKEWTKKLESYRGYFDEQENIKCGDTRKKHRTADYDYGYNGGEFAKLSID